MKARAALALLLLTASVAIAYRVRATQQDVAPASLAAYVPSDALLTIESPDFASLLHQWTHSAECKSWLASGNHSVFQNSRLFGRLTDAQTSFATAAGLPAGVDLLHQVAGKESVFAWYDIGKLQFLYITRMPAGQVDQTQLFQARASFQRRHASNADFYIRTSAADYSTVAFARVPSPSGDLVLLATREDLIANALKLIASSSSANAIQQQPWFRDVSAALPPETPAPALHMVLNLERIANDPHFRSYWIQRNITWTRQFRAAASDLYLEPHHFREERVLLPKSTTTEPAMLNLAPLAALPPTSTGVYRVLATQDPALAATAIQEKLLGRNTAPSSNPDQAPDPTVDAPQTGSATDLETRIDALPLVSPSASTDALRQLLESAGLNAVLTLSSAQNPTQQADLWIPIHSAVVLRTANSANQQALASALEQALRGELTAGGIGINFQPTTLVGVPVDALTGPRHLFCAMSTSRAQGNLILLADDESLLSELLHHLAIGSPETTPLPATSIAVFNHSTQRAPYLRLTSLIDGTNHPAQASPTPIAPASNGTTRDGAPPAFFSQNLGSLSNTFADLQSERVVERTVDSNLRETVTYTWDTQ
ncbi:MAG TPA: hypothetical protein VII58_13155 [Acidobacteriaceae bacterium]